MWYQSKTLPPNLNRIQKWRMACLFLRSSTTGCTASQLQLFHHNLLCSTKDHWGALHPSSSWGDRSRACFCGSPSLLECLPPLFLQPLSCRQEDGSSAWAKSSKAGRKILSFSKERGGDWVSCLINHSGSELAPPQVLQQQSKCWITDGAALHLQQGLLDSEHSRVSLSPSALRQQAAESAMRVLEITLRAGRNRSVRPWDRAARQEGAVVLQRHVGRGDCSVRYWLHEPESVRRWLLYLQMQIFLNVKTQNSGI